MQARAQRNQEATVYVGGLGSEGSPVNEELLWELMVQAGPVVSVSLPRDKITGELSGFGFVEFATPRDAQYASHVMNMVQLCVDRRGRASERF